MADEPTTPDAQDDNATGAEPAETHDADAPRAQNEVRPHFVPPPAPGSDTDSRKRALKTQLAAAETSGDTDAADELRDQLDALNTAGRADDHETAAARRRTAAKATGADAATTPPQGRAAPRKAATTGKAKG